MPRFFNADTVVPLVGAGLDFLQRRRGTRNAQNQLVSGAGDARNLVNEGSRRVRETLEPYDAFGRENLVRLRDLAAPGGDLDRTFDEEFKYDSSKLRETPGYQFRLDEGLKALERAGAARGMVLSGAMLKGTERFAQDYASSENDKEYGRQLGEFNLRRDVFRQNQNDRFSRLTDMVGIGERAAGAMVDNERLTANQLADLRTEEANARAAGDMEGANALSNILQTGVATIQDMQLLERIFPSAAAKIAGPAAGLASTVGGAAALGAPGVAGIPAMQGAAALGLAPELSGAMSAIGAPTFTGTAGAAGTAAAGSVPLTGYAGGGLVTSHGALIGTLTNPITIGVGAALIGAMAWMKSQAHHEANTWVQGFQNPFDQRMDQINRQFHTAAQSGQLTRDQALAIRQQVAAIAADYERKLGEFERKGNDERRVAGQARRTATQHYGQNFTGFLGKMDQAIAGLRA
jgi:hypothetical protein